MTEESSIATENAETGANTVQRPGLHRRLYDWVVGWAETRFGTPALFLISFAESSFFPIPPDPLLLALAVGNRKRALWYGFVCTVSSVLGGLAGYWIGASAMESIGQWIVDTYSLQDHFDHLREVFGEYSFLAVFTAALSFLPYKVFTIAAGACSVSLWPFVLASIAGRGLRFMSEGLLIYFFGAPIRDFIERYFNLLTIVFVVLLAGGFIAAKYAL